MITCLLLLWQFVVHSTGMGQEKNISLSQLLTDADQGKIKDVTVNGAEVTGHYREGDTKTQFHTTIPANYPDMYKTLRDHGVDISIKDQNSNAWLGILIQAAPFALLLGLWFFFLRQMQSGGNKAMSFGKSRARLLSMQQKKITFKDVAGVDEAKEELKEIFEQGKKNAPCIIFIDEIDAVGRHRGAGLGGGHDEREQTLNQLLVEMDGFESNDGVILVAATNRPDVLDPALLRPGRFDRRVVVDRPDIRGREEVLKVHSKKVPMAEDVNLNILARGTPGFSGADLANMVNEAALTAARYNRKAVHMFDFEVAKDKVMMGAERKSMLLTDEDKKVTAYHEAGHVLVAAMREHSDPLHKVTIIPRGMALGVTMHLPQEDKHSVTKDYLETELAIFMGGRCAEEIFLKQMTTGAGNDIERSTGLARRMVCEFGMSRLGPLTFGKKEEQIFLGREIAQHRDFSDDTAKEIDAEVKSFVDAAYKSAYTILDTHQDIMHRMATALLERETLDAAEIKLIIEGKELPPARSPLAHADPGSGNGDSLKVIKPEVGRKPGFGEGQPSPA